MIKHHFDINNLHHAYLIEGEKKALITEILSFLDHSGIAIANNPDFVQIDVDSFKIDDARALKLHATERGLSVGKNAKKIFIVSANNFLLEAQNSLLKLFEEPIEHTHFFVITPDTSVFIQTLISRLYVIHSPQSLVQESKQVEQFINMTPKARIDFVKELLAESEDEEETHTDSVRSKALRFLNALESTLHPNMSKHNFDVKIFEHIFKVRKFLRQPGSSPKTLMESVALVI